MKFYYYAIVEVIGHHVSDVSKMDGYDSKLHMYSLFDCLAFLDSNGIKYQVKIIPSYSLSDDAFNYYFDNDIYLIFYFKKSFIWECE